MENNKGFTLVELIIVIAIIAILTAVLAPQYLQYVEQSKKTSDIAIADSLIEAARLAVADPENDLPSGAIIEVLWATGYDNQYKDWIMVRDVAGGRSGRTSAISSTTATKLSEDELHNVQEAVIEIMGYESSNSSGDYYAVMETQNSAIAEESNFAFRIDTTTGEVAAAYAEGVDGVKNIWIDEMGMDITPVP